MQSSELRLFDRFTFVLGIFAGAVAAAALYISASVLDKDVTPPEEGSDAEAAIAARLEPVGRVVLLGDEALEAERAAAAAAVQQTRDEVLTGAQVFNQVCNVCHSSPGVQGSPLVTDAAAWEPRIAKGMDTLIEHAINGFQGDSPVPMPARGGRPDLSDDEVADAVEHMVGLVNQ